MMNIGLMNNRITIYSIKTIQDEYGDIETVKTKVLTCWCYIKQQYMKDKIASVGTLLEDSIQFVIRHTKVKLDNTMTVELNGKSYKIISIQNDIQRKQYDTIIVKAVG